MYLLDFISGKERLCCLNESLPRDWVTHGVRGGERAGVEHLNQQQVPVVGAVLQGEDVSTVNLKASRWRVQGVRKRTKSTKLHPAAS